MTCPLVAGCQYVGLRPRRLHRDAALLDRNAMDALSDVLKSVRLEGAVYLNAEFTAPWCIRGELGLASVRERLAGAEHVAFFHFLTEGSCKVRLLEGGEVLEASAGDLILFPQEGRHLMGTDLQLAPMEGRATIEPLPGADPEVFHMRYGGGGAATRFVCGYLALCAGGALHVSPLRAGDAVPHARAPGARRADAARRSRAHHSHRREERL